MIDPELLRVLTALLKTLAYIILYVLIGFGPGFVIGMVLANRFLAPDAPRRMDMHNDNIKRAGEHNSQWNPDNPRWQ